MKKILALVLSLMLLAGCVSALAENAEKESVTMLGAFSIRFNKLPEGFSMTVLRNDEMGFNALITSSDASKPIYTLTMDFNDEWDGVNTLGDATEEDIKAVEDSFYEVLEMDDGDMAFEDGQTAAGMPLLIARAVDGSFGGVYAIYMSHEIEIDFLHGDEAPITEEEMKALLDFLTDIEFVAAEK